MLTPWNYSSHCWEEQYHGLTTKGIDWVVVIQVFLLAYGYEVPVEVGVNLAVLATATGQAPTISTYPTLEESAPDV